MTTNREAPKQIAQPKDTRPRRTLVAYLLPERNIRNLAGQYWAELAIEGDRAFVSEFAEPDWAEELEMTEEEAAEWRAGLGESEAEAEAEAARESADEMAVCLQIHTRLKMAPPREIPLAEERDFSTVETRVLLEAMRHTSVAAVEWVLRQGTRYEDAYNQRRIDSQLAAIIDYLVWVDESSADCPRDLAVFVLVFAINIVVGVEALKNDLNPVPPFQWTEARRARCIDLPIGLMELTDPDLHALFACLEDRSPLTRIKDAATFLSDRSLEAEDERVERETSTKGL